MGYDPNQMAQRYLRVDWADVKGYAAYAVESTFGDQVPPPIKRRLEVLDGIRDKEGPEAACLEAARIECECQVVQEKRTERRQWRTGDDPYKYGSSFSSKFVIIDYNGEKRFYIAHNWHMQAVFVFAKILVDRNKKVDFHVLGGGWFRANHPLTVGGFSGDFSSFKISDLSEALGGLEFTDKDPGDWRTNSMRATHIDWAFIEKARDSSEKYREVWKRIFEEE
ncbi:MAG: hypothetical protein WAV48_01010 [Candidatus Magasanikiibacteriota bacterium]